jgi:hypothetical protein
MSALQNGVYNDGDDPYAGIDPEVLMQSYGVDVEPGPLNHHVSEHNGGEDDDEDLPDLDFDDQDHDDVPNSDELLQAFGLFNTPNTVINETQAHIQHPPVKVPRHSSPFVGRPEQEQAFLLMLNHPDLQQEYIPLGLNVYSDEWDGEGYPTHQEIKIGARRRAYPIELPVELWLPRARRWARGINILYTFLRPL